MSASVARVEDRAVAAHDPSILRRNERYAIHGRLGVDGRRSPCRTAIYGMTDRAIDADDPPLLVVNEEHARQLHRRAAGLFFPLLPAVYRLENRPAPAHRPPELGIPEIHAHERDLGPGFLGSDFQLWFSRVYGWNVEREEEQKQDGQESQRSHPPNPGAPRRTSPQPRPQKARRGCENELGEKRVSARRGGRVSSVQDAPRRVGVGGVRTRIFP